MSSEHRNSDEDGSDEKLVARCLAFCRVCVSGPWRVILCQKPYHDEKERFVLLTALKCAQFFLRVKIPPERLRRCAHETQLGVLAKFDRRREILTRQEELLCS